MSVGRHHCPKCGILMTCVIEEYKESHSVEFFMTPSGWEERNRESGDEIVLTCGHCKGVVDSTDPAFVALIDMLPDEVDMWRD